MDVLNPDMLKRYDRPGPRYTSYPTAAEFHPQVDGKVYHHHLNLASRSPEEPLSLYLHLPFCQERCLYCGCNVVSTRKLWMAEIYLERLEEEIRSVARRLGDRRRLRQMHWGGGTPTYLSASQLRRLDEVVRQEFEFEDEAEIAIEIDPRVTTDEQLATLRDLGFNRLSLGIQDFASDVQEAIGRVQSFKLTRHQVEFARQLGFTAINFDLIYGLPLQTPSSFAETLQLVTWLRPDRLAVYSYAHMPWLVVQQRRIDPESLPSPQVKLQLISNTVTALTDAGYLAIGMDHFALPEDELGQAAIEGRLWRNFMGYTVRHAPDLVGCGTSAIGEVCGAYFQNEKKLGRYQKAVHSGLSATVRGYVLSEDDLLRRHVITALMCNSRLDYHDVEERFGIDFSSHFRAELQALETLAEDGLVNIRKDGMEVVGLGRLLVRSIAREFDAFRRREPVTEASTHPKPARFSRMI